MRQLELARIHKAAAAAAYVCIIHDEKKADGESRFFSLSRFAHQVCMTFVHAWNQELGASFEKFLLVQSNAITKNVPNIITNIMSVEELMTCLSLSRSRRPL